MTFRLHGFGLSFQSDIAIRGAAEGLLPGAQTIAIGVRDGLAGIEPHVYRRDGDRILFNAAGIGQYGIARERIDLALLTDADLALAGDLMVSTALPALLWMRGRFLLHAGAVMLPGQERAIAIAGPSGSGKSTIIASLLDEGATLVADDSLSLDQQLCATGLPAGLFLGRGTSRHFVPHPATGPSMAVPLESILFLFERSACETMEALRGADAFTAITENRHRPGIPALLGQTRHGIALAAEIARKIPLLGWWRCEGDTAVGIDRLRELMSKPLKG